MWMAKSLIIPIITKSAKKLAGIILIVMETLTIEREAIVKPEVSFDYQWRNNVFIEK